MHQTTQL